MSQRYSLGVWNVSTTMEREVVLVKTKIVTITYLTFPRSGLSNRLSRKTTARATTAEENAA